MPCVLSLQVFNVSAINENRPENTILFQTLVRGAVMMIRPPTSFIGDRASDSRSFSASIVSRSQASTSGVGHSNNRADWTKLRLPSLASVSSLACCLAGVHDAVVNESVQPDKRLSITRCMRRVRNCVCVGIMLQCLRLLQCCSVA